MTYLLMGLFLIVYVAIALFGAKYNPDKENFFDIYDSTVLKGLFCIIVVLVHIPEAQQNRIQDMMGSFAYIGVTFFFMTSAYGLKWGVIHKENYLHGFWPKRLSALLLPAFLCNLLGVGVSVAISKPVEIWSLIYINEWVGVLLLFYVVFWIIYYLPNKLKVREGYWQDVLICLIVVTCSLIDRLTSVKLTLIWPTESLGFAYGVLLADCFELFKKWSAKQWGLKSIFLFLMGAVTGVAYLKLKPIDFWGDYCLKIFLGIVLLLLILQLTRKFNIGNKMSQFLGSISYEVYLLHGTIFSAVLNIGLANNSGIFIWLAVVFVILAAAFISWLSGQILAKAGKIKTIMFSQQNN